MQIFTATHHAETPRSSFVRSVDYNDQTKQCLVHISEALGNVRAYLYNDVPLHEYSALVSAQSVGEHYNSFFKNAYGPARTTFADAVHEVEVRDAAVPFPRQEEKATEDVQEFSLTYTWQGKDFPSFTVETTDLMDAVRKLAGILNELGLTGAVIQVPVDELV
jgi:hypothetical protein